jgi:hypothetical protein
MTDQTRRASATAVAVIVATPVICLSLCLAEAEKNPAIGLNWIDHLRAWVFHVRSNRQ